MTDATVRIEWREGGMLHHLYPEHIDQVLQCREYVYAKALLNVEPVVRVIPVPSNVRRLRA